MKEAINFYIENIIEHLETGDEAMVRAYFHGLGGMIFGFWMLNIITFEEHDQLKEIESLIADELRETGVYLYC